MVKVYEKCSRKSVVKCRICVKVYQKSVVKRSECTKECRKSSESWSLAKNLGKCSQVDGLPLGEIPGN
jgi:hypothetical protein